MSETTEWIGAGSELVTAAMAFFAVFNFWSWKREDTNRAEQRAELERATSDLRPS